MSPKRKRRKGNGIDFGDEGNEEDDSTSPRGIGIHLQRAAKPKDSLIKLLKACL